MIRDKKIGFIGFGQMGGAIGQGMLQAGLVKPEQIYISENAADRLDFARKLKLNIAAANTELAKNVDILVIAVKPQIVNEVLAEIAKSVPDSALVVSIVGSLAIKSIEQLLPGKAVIRVIPNTPAAVGEGVTAIAKGSLASQEQLEAVKTMFNSVGKVLTVEEQFIDPIMAISGCGPAYGYIIIDAIADAGVRMGLTRQHAIMLAAQTLRGAASMVLESGEHPAALKDAVCSPGGSTIAGVQALEQAAVRGGLISAVTAGLARSREITKATE